MTTTTNQHGDHIKAHADMESEDKASPVFPRVRQLDVTDAHLVALLAGITLLLLDQRRHGVQADGATLEMQAAINAMVSA